MTTDPIMMPFEVVNIHETGPYLILRVNYFDSPTEELVLVFEQMRIIDAMKWRRIDPSFVQTERGPSTAPCPVAIFPGTDSGWRNGIHFVTAMQNTAISHVR